MVHDITKDKILIHLIAAARPNFMKIAPLYHALKKTFWANPKIIHTGQHYDLNMSDVFFQDLSLSAPDIHLGVGSGSHAEQTGQVMISYEKVLLETQPDLVVVVGDVNSTIACTLAATKVTYPKIPVSSKPYRVRPIVAHLEAGLRSFDRDMPEEINRIVTDVLADILLTPSSDGDEHLIKEGIAREKIYRVGNIMIDSLELLRDKIESLKVWKELDLEKGKYGLVTLHRPSNVDNPETLEALCDLLIRISTKTHLVFPLHPRTRKNLETHNLLTKLSDTAEIKLIEPQSYIRFMNLAFNCRMAITDSGGIQEETTYLGIPCFTLRPNTERPITVTHGTNQLCSIDNIETQIDATFSQKEITKTPIEFWDGKTAARTAEVFQALFKHSITASAFTG